MSDEPENTAAASPVKLGDNPAELEFGCGVKGDKVIIKFNTMVQWFDLDPLIALDFAEAIITCAKEATKHQRIVVPRVAAGTLQ